MATFVVRMGLALSNPQSYWSAITSCYKGETYFRYKLLPQVQEVLTLFDIYLIGIEAAQSPSDHAMMNSYLDPAVGRFQQLNEEDQDEFRGLLNTFRNLYGFLSQVIPFQDSDLEKLYTFARFLASKLPHRATGEKYVMCNLH